MGSYTTNLKLYKPAATEFVDVETQINANWSVADSAVKRLLEYEYTTEKTPPISDALARSRFYKSYSNSVMAYFPSSGSFYQDPGSFVSQWNHMSNAVFIPPYTEHPDYPVSWRIIRKANSPTTAEIEWTGAFWIGGATMALNTNVSMMILPATTIPTVTKYFTVNAGNTSANYSIARVGFFSGSNDLQFKRYGPAGSGTTADENRVELTGIKYNVEVAA